MYDFYKKEIIFAETNRQLDRDPVCGGEMYDNQRLRIRAALCGSSGKI